MAYASINGIDLFFNVYGNGEPLVLIHGFTGFSGQWKNHIPILSEKYHVIAPDLRGHGKSTGIKESLRHRFFAEDLIALLDFLNIEKAHFVGHSSGGMCLFYIGIEHRSRVLSLVLSAATYTFDEIARKQIIMETKRRKENLEAIRLLQSNHGNDHCESYWKKLLSAFEFFSLTPSELPFTLKDLQEITCPVLIIHGDRDSFFPIHIPIAMHEAISTSQLCILPDTHHGLPFQRKDLFIDITLDFLSNQTKC